MPSTPAMSTIGELLVSSVLENSSSPRSLATAWLVIGLGMVASACIGPDVDPEVDADTGTTHILITVDHRTVNATTADEEPETQAAALAGFAQIPSDVDSEAVLSLAQWSLELPEIGGCVALSAERDRNTPLAPIERVELLAVGDVVIDVDGSETRLAPRAFTGGDVLTGVLYTSRDPSADPLPPGQPYTIHTTGDALPGQEFRGDAPPTLSGVTLGGVPLAQVATVKLSEPLDLTWNVGSPEDVLYVELTSDDGLNATRCAFRDEDGAGTVPEGAFGSPGSGSLSLHRLRSLAIGGEDIRGELRFDVGQFFGVVYVPG